MAWTYHTSMQHHRRKRPINHCIRHEQQQKQQHEQHQCHRLSNFHWTNSFVMFFLFCSLLFQHFPITTSAEVRFVYILICIV